jgi:DNA-binding response OmpR family regulator
MAAQQNSNGVRRVRFGLFEADLMTGELRRSGILVRLQSQPFKLLAALLEEPGQVVSARLCNSGFGARTRPLISTTAWESP